MCSFETPETPTQWHCITTHETCILSNTAVETLNVVNKYSIKEDVGFEETEDYRHLICMKW